METIEKAKQGKLTFSGRVDFTIFWQASADSESANIKLKNNDIAEEHNFTQYLAAKETSTPMSNGSGISYISVWLKKEEDTVELWLSFPIDSDSVFRNAISNWNYHKISPIAPALHLDSETSFNNVHMNNWESVFPFLCLDTTPTEISEAELNQYDYIINQNIDKVTLYQQLIKNHQGPIFYADAQKTISQFIKSKNFINSFYDLEVPFKFLPGFFKPLMGLSRGSTDTEIEKHLSTWANQPISLDKLVNSKQAKDINNRIWSSLIALLLTNSPPTNSICLLRDLIASVRVMTFLTWVDNSIPISDLEDSEHTPAPSIDNNWFKLLSAAVVLPDNLVLIATPPKDKDPNGWYQIAGIGEVREVYLKSKTYQLGDIAQIVSLAAGESRTTSEQTRQFIENKQIDYEEDNFVSTNESQINTTNELTYEIKNILAVDEDYLNASKLMPSYDNLGLVINGSSDQVDTKDQSNASLAQGYAKSIMDRASDNVKHKVTSIRESTQVDVYIKTAKAKLDNTGKDHNTNAIYRWVDMVHHFDTKNKGKALIIEFMINEPAKAFLSSIENYHNVSITQPSDNGLFDKPSNYKKITPQNYLEFQAQFQANELPSPPESQIVLQDKQFNDGATLISGSLTIPEGYTAATTNTVKLVVSDDSKEISGYVGDTNNISHVSNSEEVTQAILTGGSGPSQPIPKPEKVVLPDPKPAIYTDNFSVPSNNLVSFAFSCQATEFSAEVTLTLSADTSSGSDFPQKLTAWQQDVFKALNQAYQKQFEKYNLVKKERLQQASKNQTRKIERDNLKSSAIEILSNAVNNQSSQDLRFFDRAFLWEEMSYQFFPWSAGQPVTQVEYADQYTIPISNDALFKAFLSAKSCRMLVPVNPRLLTQLTLSLAFYQLANSLPANEVTTASMASLLNSLNLPLDEESLLSTEWSKRVPTTLMYLQLEDSLPNFPSSVVSS